MAFTIPASTKLTNLPHSSVVYYKRKALENLKKKIHFSKLCMPDVIPRQNGRQIQWFRYTPFSAPTPPVPTHPEGDLPAGRTLTSTTITATLAEYSDWLTLSSAVVETAIDPVIEAAAEEIGYLGALTCDVLIREEINSAGTAGTPLGTTATADDFFAVASLFEGADVRPFEDGLFPAIVHPYIVFDLRTDPSAGSMIDLFKTHDPEFWRRKEDRDEVAVLGGCRIISSTNVTIRTGTPNKYRAYFAGFQGVGCVELAGRGPAMITDPQRERFNVSVVRDAAPSKYDPVGTIQGIVGYRYWFVAKVLDPTRVKYIDFESTIG